MNYTTLSSWGPEKTPATIKYLIIFTAVAAILSAAMQSIFDQFDLFPGPQNLLSLSWWGIKKGFVWQPLSFLFVQESQGGLTFFFFISLLLNLYLLWTIGSAVFQVIGKGPFLRLYLIGGMAAGILSLLSMELTGQHEMLTGMGAALLILFTVWSMAFPETEILLFFLIPVKVKWIVATIVGIMLLISLSHFDLTRFILYLTAVLIGYCYAVMSQGWYSPFPFTLRFDIWLSRLGAKIRRAIPFKGKSKEVKTPDAKIVDISTGQTIKDDDAFVDAMLAKISRKGEESLTWSEKKRLEEISKKKMRYR
jgi:Rhomboid family